MGAVIAAAAFEAVDIVAANQVVGAGEDQRGVLDHLGDGEVEAGEVVDDGPVGVDLVDNALRQGVAVDIGEAGRRREDHGQPAAEEGVQGDLDDEPAGVGLLDVGRVVGQEGAQACEGRLVPGSRNPGGEHLDEGAAGRDRSGQGRQRRWRRDGRRRRNRGHGRRRGVLQRRCRHHEVHGRQLAAGQALEQDGAAAGEVDHHALGRGHGIEVAAVHRADAVEHGVEVGDDVLAVAAGEDEQVHADAAGQGVCALAANQGVVAVVADQQVVAGPAVEDQLIAAELLGADDAVVEGRADDAGHGVEGVLAVADHRSALEEVVDGDALAGPGVDGGVDAVLARAGDQRTHPDEGGVAGVPADHHIVASPALQVVAALATDQPVVAAVAVEPVREARALQPLDARHLDGDAAAGDGLVDQADDHALQRVQQQEVQSAPAIDGVGLMVGGRDEVVAVAAAQDAGAAGIVGAGQPVVAGPAVEQVGPETAGQDVVALAAEQQVVARPAAQAVDVLAAMQDVVAIAAAQAVVAFAAKQQVVALGAVHNVVAVAAVELVVLQAAGHLVVALAAVGPRAGGGEDIAASAAVDVAGRAVAGDRHPVLAGPAEQADVAVEARDHVVAGPAGQGRGQFTEVEGRQGAGLDAGQPHQGRPAVGAAVDVELHQGVGPALQQPDAIGA